MKTQKLFKLGAALLALVMVGTVAFAVSIVDSEKQSMRSEGGRGERSMRTDSQTSAKRQMTTVRGEIVATKTITVRGTDTEHQVARIRTDRDNIVMVDLGPKTRDLNQLDLSEGQRITVTGLGRESRGRRLLLADRVQVGGESVSIRKPQMKRVQGQVVAAEDVAVRRTGQKNRVVILRTSKGKLPVDLGPANALQELDLEQGTQMKAEGKLVQVQGKPVLMASMFKAGNERSLRAVNR